jgi:GTP cyclohydrolase I
MATAYKVAWEFSKRFPDKPDPIVGRVGEPSAIARLSIPITLESPALIVDDIVDTGHTIAPFKDQQTLSLLVRNAKGETPTFWGRDLGGATDYVNFPWDEKSMLPEEAVVRLLEFLGLDPNDPNVKETPRRFLSWLAEFQVNQPEPEMTSFAGITYDQMIIVKDIPLLSLCEHHLMPFSGVACVAYIPKEAVLGLSKLARIVQHQAKRPQVQERLTEEIMAKIKDVTGAVHVGVVLKAEHTCMSLRGPRVQGSTTITSAMHGDFLNDPKTREEFLKLSGF